MQWQQLRCYFFLYVYSYIMKCYCVLLLGSMLLSRLTGCVVAATDALCTALRRLCYVRKCALRTCMHAPVLRCPHACFSSLHTCNSEQFSFCLRLAPKLRRLEPCFYSNVSSIHILRDASVVLAAPILGHQRVGIIAGVLCSLSSVGKICLH